jgi:prophage regulatory protein
MTKKKLRKPRKLTRNVENRNADNHDALLAVVGETVTRPAHAKRISLFHELEVLGVLYSRRHLDRLEMEGKFPKRVALGEGRVGWVTSEVVAHVDFQIESRSLDAGTLGSGDSCRPTNPAAIARARRKEAKSETTA